MLRKVVVGEFAGGTVEEGGDGIYGGASEEV